MLRGMIGSIMSRLAGGDPAVLRAMREDPAVMHRLGDPRVVLAIESINLEPEKLEEFQDDQEVLELLYRVATLAGFPEGAPRARALGGEEVELTTLIPEEEGQEELQELERKHREEEVRRRFAELQSQRASRARSGMGAGAALLQYDVRDWESQPWFHRTALVGRVLASKGFCVLKGSLDTSELEKASLEAQKLKKSGGFMRPPRETLSGLFGELASAWTRELSDPNSPAPPEDEGLRACDSVLEQLGSEIAGVTESCFRMRIKGRTVGVAHLSRMPEDRPNPPLVDPEEADGYMMLFMRKKLKLIYYVGPVNAVMRIYPIGDEIQAYKTTIEAGTIVVLRGDVCRCGLDPLSSHSGLSVEVDFLAAEKLGPQENVRDRVPPPDELADWYEQRLKAIVDNDVMEDVPEDWMKLARSTYFKVTNPPTGVCEVSHSLPTTELPEHQWSAPFDACAVGGSDGISEIPSSKWDMTVYYDEDPKNVDNYKMYTRHMGIVTGSSDFSLPEFGLSPQEAADIDPRYIRLCESTMTLLRKAEMSREDTQGKDVGIFLGLSGGEMQYQMVSRKARLTKTSYINSSNANSVSRLTYLLGSRGPGISLDTEDSSGLAAVDSSVNYLRMDRCSLALASSISLIQHPLSLIVLCAAGTISWSGRCRVLDESSDGNVRSEAVVTVLLRSLSRQREKDYDDWAGEERCEALITGTALNSKGISSSLTAPSGPAIQDVIHRALRDARYPASILQALEMNATGAALADVMELGVMKKAFEGSATENVVVLRNFKSVHGDTGPPSGLVSMVRCCYLLARAVHGPVLHLRELSEIGESQMEEELDDPTRPTTTFMIATEAVEAATVSHHVGVDSFSTTGTNVHQIVWGDRPEEKRRPYRGTPITWFPVTADKNASSSHGGWREENNDSRLPMQASYYIIGSWNNWESPIKMHLDAAGEWSYVIKLGENRWETFQIWIEGDQDRVLHPSQHFSLQDSDVLGPSDQQQVGRVMTWKIDGQPDKVRLINEEQFKIIKEEAMKKGFMKFDADLKRSGYVLAFSGGYKPAGHENASGPNEMPEMLRNPDLIGKAGDLYKVRFLLNCHGKYRKVEWTKLPSTQAPRLAQDFEHAYYIVGDFSFWGFQQMEADGDGLHVARVQLLAPRSTFQIVKDRDWDQAFFPLNGSGQDAEVHGPKPLAFNRAWTIEGEPGDVFAVAFGRSTGPEGEDTASLSWHFEANEAYDIQEITQDFEYFIVGSWSVFAEMAPMEPDEDRGVFTVDVAIGESGRESFQILLNGNWAALIHPSLKSASFRGKDNAVQGPHNWGSTSVWTIGDDPEDECRPGAIFRISLRVWEGRPSSVRWERRVAEETEAPDLTESEEDEAEEPRLRAWPPSTAEASCQSGEEEALLALPAPA